MEDIEPLRLLLVLLMLAFSALFSGLTLGLMSLSEYELKRKMELGNKRAAKVYPLRRRGNELLVTLLVGNVLVNAVLTVLLGSFLSGLFAVIISTVAITLFGEIFPQALLKKHGLKFGAIMAPGLSKLMLLMWPISHPLAKLIDETVGTEMPTVYSRQELVKIFEEHRQHSGSDIEEDELRLVRGALRLGHRDIESVMSPRSVVEAVEIDETIDDKRIEKLYRSGFSRFPVLDGDKVKGMLYIRDLALARTEGSGNNAGDLMDKKVYYVNERQPLDHALNSFIRTKHHLFIVVNEFNEMVGVVSIEDVLEEIIGKEIMDEFDKHDDMRHVAKLRAKSSQLKVQDN